MLIYYLPKLSVGEEILMPQLLMTASSSREKGVSLKTRSIISCGRFLRNIPGWKHKTMVWENHYSGLGYLSHHFELGPQSGVACVFNAGVSFTKLLPNLLEIKAALPKIRQTFYWWWKELLWRGNLRKIDNFLLLLIKIKNLGYGIGITCICIYVY